MGTSSTLSGRTAVVSGGGSGIGRATVERFEAEEMRTVAADLPEYDVRSRASIDALYQKTKETLGVPDVVVAAAGVGIHETLIDGDPDKWAEAFEVNLLGALRLARAFAFEMTGDLIFIGSVASSRPYESGGPYAASKAGLAMAAETLRLELKGRVRTTILSPGAVRTALFDRELTGPRDFHGEVIEPQDVADAIVYAISRPPNVAVHELTIRPRGQSY
jgi:NADP-dependent 3-hydroxy acid dehydrogenase YdfG